MPSNAGGAAAGVAPGGLSLSCANGGVSAVGDGEGDSRDISGLAASEADMYMQYFTERRRVLHATATEESQKQQAFRMKQRFELTDAMLKHDQWYNDQLLAARHMRKQRALEQTKASPFKVDPLVELAAAERRRCQSTGSLRSKTQGARQFREAMSMAFASRTHMRDEIEDLRVEKRRLLEQERELRLMMEAEKSRLRQERAAMFRPNNKEEILARKQQREDERMQQEEFYRSLTGWDGSKAKTRTKPVKALWKEHKAKQDARLRGPSGGLLQAPGAGADDDLDRLPSAGAA